MQIIFRWTCVLRCLLRRSTPVYTLRNVAMGEVRRGNGLLENWKCILACTLVSMSPFQYGIDFGAIGGLQAMKGFLEV